MSLLKRVKTRLSGFQADVDPHHWRFTKYSSPKKRRSRVTVIPDPAILRNVFIPSGADVSISTSTETSLNYPDIGHGAVHLCLLECFRNLRLSASSLDVQIDQPPTYQERDVTRSGAVDDNDSDENDEDDHDDDDDDDTPTSPTALPESQRWDLLVRLAVTRFNTWWMNIHMVLQHAAAYTPYGGDKHMLQLTKDYLPPLDVLLVWYAFMLNDEAYASACEARSVPRLRDLCFPWPAIRDSVDTESMIFTLSRAAKSLFETLSGQNADIFTYMSEPPAYTTEQEILVDINLFAEVKRHQEFMDKAHELLWIRSPSLRSSLERANSDYFKLKWSGKLPSIDAIGTLPFGVDLIWRTHKLHTSHYQTAHGMALEGLDTDLKVPSNGEQMPELANMCACWICERIRDDIAEFAYDESRTRRYDVVTLGGLSSSQISSIKDDIGFHRSAEKARKLGRPLPTRARTEAEKEEDRQRKEDLKRWSSIEVPQGY